MILSAQTTDRKVNEVTRVLFARYRTAADYAAADQAELEKVIAPTGYFRAKAKTLIALGHALSDRFGGEVPDTLEELVTLPGGCPVSVIKSRASDHHPDVRPFLIGRDGIVLADRPRPAEDGPAGES